MTLHKAILTVIISMALHTQQNPALGPRIAPKPALPQIVKNACPFEGCTLGAWRTRKAAVLYSTWEPQRKAIRKLPPAQPVTALTGIHIMLEPAEIEITAPVPQYGLKPGDIVFAYMNLGEGFFNAWFNGYWVEEFDGSGVQYPDGSGCSRNCSAVQRKPGRWEWWVKIRTRDGLVGWTKDTENFDGSDALGH
jgi:hypothetical protein